MSLEFSVTITGIDRLSIAIFLNRLKFDALIILVLGIENDLVVVLVSALGTAVVALELLVGSVEAVIFFFSSTTGDLVVDDELLALLLAYVFFVG